MSLKSRFYFVNDTLKDSQRYIKDQKDKENHKIIVFSLEKYQKLSIAIKRLWQGHLKNDWKISKSFIIKIKIKEY